MGTPIHKAVWFGHTEIVKILAPLSKNPNAPDKHGRTPINFAAQNGHINVQSFKYTCINE